MLCAYCSAVCVLQCCLYTAVCALQMVGPLLTRDAEPLPADLDRFLSQQQGIGAVYVSMGTLLRQTEAELLSMARAFSELANPVLWKLNAKHMPGELCLFPQFPAPHKRLSEKSSLKRAAVLCYTSGSSCSVAWTSQCCWHKPGAMSASLLHWWFTGSGATPCLPV